MESDAPLTVLIVGCGPVGLFAAYMLGKRGVRTLLIDKHYARRGQPKAHALNPRTLEIFREEGLDIQHLRSIGIDPRKVDVVHFVSKFYGWEFGVLPYERQFADVKPLTPEPLLNIAQPLVEELLLEEVQKLSSVEIERGLEWQGADNAEQSRKITSTVLRRANGEKFVIESQYLLCCDGARALSRSALGIGFEPVNGTQANEKHHVTIHFQAELPGQPGILWFIMQPHGARCFIRYGDSEWVLVRRFDPTASSALEFDDDRCREMIEEALGKSITVELLSTTIWASSTKVAAAYRSDKVRNAFLLGDAAHTFPPTGGLGVNTGLADVHNLIWKLKLVRDGVAMDSLLDTYGKERRAVAVVNATQSHVNEKNMDLLGQTINPRNVFTEGSDWKDPDFQQRVKSAIDRNSEHFDSLDLQLGSIYGEERPPGKDVSIFIPQAIVGGRLPHCYVMRNGETSGEKSTLDLIDPCGFTLISPNLNLWKEASANLAPKWRCHITVAILKVDFDPVDDKWLDMMFSEQRNRAVLVRPDQHILGFIPAGQPTVLSDMLDEYLCRP